MALPNFVVPGVAKCGTGSLHKTLLRHPDVYVPRGTKNPRFFNTDEYFYGPAYYEMRFYTGYRGEKAIGDPTASYHISEAAPARMREVLGPDLKLIFLLRDPIKRAFSDYRMAFSQFRENRSFERAIEEEDQLVEAYPSIAHGIGYAKRGMFGEQIKRYRDHFDAANFKIVIMEEDLGEQQPQTYREIFDLIGVATPSGSDLSIVHNQSKGDVKFADYAPGELKPSGKSMLRKVAERLTRSRRLIHGKELSDAAEHERVLLLTVRDKSYRTFVAPSSYVQERAATYYENLSSKLDPDFAQALYRKRFCADIKQLEGLIDRDLSVWKHPYE